uniref:Uncharacterized protein n=1 Tax=Ditylenchus dipsaci TaxID=166011 RepID=A0A915CZN0_9BILA
MFRRSSAPNEAIPQPDLNEQRNQPNLLIFSGENEESSSGSGLFKEYLSRGLYTCTSRYVQTITKLNALIKEAYDQYSSCQN